MSAPEALLSPIECIRISDDAMCDTIDYTEAVADFSMFKGVTLFAFLAVSGAAAAQDTPEQITYISCRSCHGMGEGEGAIPAIRGRPYEDLVATLQSFTQQGGASTIMHQFMVGFSDAEIVSLARYVSGVEGKAE